MKNNAVTSWSSWVKSAAPPVGFVALVIVNARLVVSAAERALQTPATHQTLLMLSVVVALLLHGVLVVSFGVLLNTTARVLNSELDVPLRGILLSLSEAHLPLALWAAGVTIALTGSSVRLGTPADYFLAMDVMFWSRASAYVAALMWFCSSLSSRSSLLTRRISLCSFTAAAVLLAVMSAANVLLSVSEYGRMR